MLSTRRGKRLVAGIVVVLSMWIDHCQSAPRAPKAVVIELRAAPVARVPGLAPVVAPRPHPTVVRMGPPDVTWSKQGTVTLRAQKPPGRGCTLPDDF
jgi:hypothetical protein